MSGTYEGGLKAAKANRAHREDYYEVIGHKGGSVKNKRKGFGSMDPEKRRLAAIKGGLTRRENYHRKAKGLPPLGKDITFENTYEEPTN